MRNQIREVIAVCFILLLGAEVCVGQGPKPIKLNPSYKHDRWETRPNDIIKKFQAFTVSFDSDDDDDRDGTRDRWAIPQWVAYEVKRFPGKLPKGPDRPEWFTDAALFKKKIAPNDDSYHFAEALKPKFPFDRGHMCAKYTAFRLGADADWNTHTLLNACPQRDTMNRGIWEDLERKVDAWADKFGAVWIICGPIVDGNKPKKFLGQAGEVPVAIPNAFFKIVVKEGAAPKRPDVLAFVYPNRHIDQSADNHAKYLVSVDSIEARTGLDFLRKLPPSIEPEIESKKAVQIWK